MKPMLASPAPQLVQFPVYASPKLDGVRALVRNGRLVSRSLKAIPNAYCQELFGTAQLEGLDGELIVGSPTAPNAMQATTSGVMSKAGVPDVIFYVFDTWTSPDDAFHRRYAALKKAFEMTYGYARAASRLRLLDQVILRNGSELAEYEKAQVGAGYEGVMLRSFTSPYKYGRSTAKDGYLLKVKRFADGEATVVGFEERMHNANEAQRNELGQLERSTAKDGLVPMGTLGALLVEDIKTGVAFRIGTGFDDALRQHIWNRRHLYVDQIVTYKHFETGVKVAPRFPVFKGFRHDGDM